MIPRVRTGRITGGVTASIAGVGDEDDCAFWDVGEGVSFAFVSSAGGGGHLASAEAVMWVVRDPDSRVVKAVFRGDKHGWEAADRWARREGGELEVVLVDFVRVGEVA